MTQASTPLSASPSPTSASLPYARAVSSVRYVADVLSASSPLFPNAEEWLALTQVCALVMLPLLFLFCSMFPAPAA